MGSRKILQIKPNSITWKGQKRREYVREYRTNDKVGKRLYSAFKPLWYAVHAWDTLFANHVQPTWNLGFDTLTEYPVAGANSPVDGRVYRGPVNETFGTIRAGAGSTGDATVANDNAIFLLATTTSNQYQFLCRSGYTFDTSDLTSSATISSAVLSIYGSGKSNALGSPGLDIVAFTPAATNDIAAADYAQFGTTVYATKAYADFSTSAYNDFTLDANGRANISKTGISKFGATLTWDTANSFTGAWASGAISTFQAYFADQTGTSNDPKLVVTYTLPTASGGAFLMNFI